MKQNGIGLSAGAERGLTLLEVMLVLVIVVTLAAITIPIYTNVLDRSRTGAVVADAHTIHQAMLRFNVDEGRFPTWAEFDVATLAPLSTNGYFESPETFNQKLDGGQIHLYLGMGDEFLMVFAPEHKPGEWIYIFHTDVFGLWRDGIYMLVKGKLVKSDYAS